MHAAGRAIGWEFRGRLRVALIALATYVAVFGAIKVLILGSAYPIKLDPPNGMGGWLMAPLASVYFYLVGVFSFGLSGDLAARQSIYPARMFTRPVTNAALAGWPTLNKLYRQYRDRAAFYVVYIQEAHPIDAWQVDDNLKDDVLVASTMTADDRLKVAGLCVKNLGIEMPALVDDPDNRAERDYTGWPDRLYVVDRDGHISYKSAPGPFGFKPAEVEAALKRLLPAR